MNFIVGVYFLKVDGFGRFEGGFGDGDEEAGADGVGEGLSKGFGKAKEERVVVYYHVFYR